jgi:hypothetical protein
MKSIEKKEASSMTVNVGDGVRITQSAREEMLVYRQEGQDTDMIRANRAGIALE